MSEEDRRGPTGLLGPKNPAEYAAWRRNRDRMIANPRRLKTCKDEQPEKEPQDDATDQFSREPQS